MRAFTTLSVVVLGSAIHSATAQPTGIVPFGSAISQGRLTQTETQLFNHTLSAGATHGVITHWWITGGASMDHAILSFYLDGETTPSIRINPPMACGAGFVDEAAPWANAWFGKVRSLIRRRCGRVDWGELNS